jgi:putative photosynthetic complex assembly protein
MQSQETSSITLIAVVASGLLMVTSVIGVNLHQNRKLAAPAQVEEVPVVQSRQLRFVDQGDGVSVYGGHVRVFDVATGKEYPELRADEGFVRTVLNSLAFERTKRGIVNQVPVFELTAWKDNKLTLTDPATGVHIGLGQFGIPNRAAFERFLAPVPQRSEANS